MQVLKSPFPPRDDAYDHEADNYLEKKPHKSTLHEGGFRD